MRICQCFLLPALYIGNWRANSVSSYYQTTYENYTNRAVCHYIHNAVNMAVCGGFVAEIFT
jgi:hypothetical protein